jgi:hypothetical protein
MNDRKLELLVPEALLANLERNKPTGVDLRYKKQSSRGLEVAGINWIELTISWAASIPVGVLTHYLIKYLENKRFFARVGDKFEESSTEKLPNIMGTINEKKY